MDALYGIRHGAPPRVALVHDWLVTYGGAEGLLAELVRCLPGAPLHVLVDFFSEEQRRQLGDPAIVTSFVQSLPAARRNYWYYAPLMAAAVERFDLRPYDLVLSSSHSFAKGVLVDPDQLHLSYVHSPVRFAWDLQEYYLERFGWTRGPKKLAALSVFHYLRGWDVRGAHAVDLLLCNSEFVRRRILKAYRRAAYVVYPPIDTERFALREDKEDFYLAGSFMNPFKRIDLVVEAFAGLPDRRLVVFGEGPDLARCQRLAGPNVTFVGRLSNEDLVAHLQAARAFVFAAPEDFGMLMAEAQACGTPVLAYGKGGACEIVRDLNAEEPTGALFPEQTPEALREAVRRFERARRVSPEACRASALRFTTDRFRSRIGRVLDVCWQRWSTERWPRQEEQLFPLFDEGLS